MSNSDMRLLEILSLDARLSHEEIAVMMGMDTADVDKRISELEKEGIIIGYSAVINPERIEDDSVHALIEVKVTPQRNQGFDSIAELIYSFDEVQSCYLMSGAYDLMVIVQGRNIKEVSAFVAEKLSILDNVLSCSTHVILKRYKDNGRIFVNKDSDKRLAVSP